MTNPVDKDSLPLNQPRRTPSHPTKSHIVKTKVDGKEKIIRFGQQGASTAGKPKEGESDHMKAKRASFKARHSANIAKGPSSAAYWANKVKWSEGGLTQVKAYAKGGEVDETKAAFGIYPKQRAKPSSKETKAAAAEAAQFAAEMIIPQTPMDAGLMLIPGGKIARKAGAALIGLDASDAEAGGLSALRKFRELINREAPEQAKKIREALLRTQQTGREHSVIGLANEGGESVITRGTNDSVLPNTFDLRTAKRAPGSPTIVDFHTHPGQGYSIFETAPSRKDFEFYATEYPSKAGRDLRTMIAVPPTKDGSRRTTSYNFFETQDPAKVFDPRTLDAARFEMQRAGGKGSFKSIQDDPVLREYFDYGGDLGSILEDAAPLALMRYRAGQGLGRHELQLGGSQLAPSPGATDVELFRQLEGPALEILRSKKFAEGGSVSDYDPFQVDEIMNSIDAPRNYAEGGEVKAPDLEFKEDPDSLRLYQHAMKQMAPNREDSVSNLGLGMRTRTAGGDFSAGLDMNRMTQGQQDQLMKSLAANYNVNLGNVNVNAMMQKPLDAKDVYVGMINGSIPLAEGRAMLGIQGVKTPYGTDVLGYNAGWSGKVGPGQLNANINVPKRGKPSGQVQYQIPFAEGGSVSAYDPDQIDAIANQFM
jgi:hypothetical protein